MAYLRAVMQFRLARGSDYVLTDLGGVIIARPHPHNPDSRMWAVAVLEERP